MKKYLVIPFLAVMAFTACKKKENTVSTLVTASAPTISISGSSYYSIPVGGALPSISATSYDSFYKQSYPVVVDQSTLDNTTPGLYVVNITAKNKYGMVGSTGIYVAVTNISPAIHLEGIYQRLSNLQQVNVTRRANGLYEIDNVGGVPPPSSSIVPALFVQVDDTTMSFPLQSTSQGSISGFNTGISMMPSDTTFQYQIEGPFNRNAVRVFQKL
ncbi:MAG: hypothetical protein H7257_02295 [Taibaiella sp.]|nr:hypothetical protein [Taibaiella sp.]